MWMADPNLVRRSILQKVGPVLHSGNIGWIVDRDASKRDAATVIEQCLAKKRLALIVGSEIWDKTIFFLAHFKGEGQANRPRGSTSFPLPVPG
jgi:hypothetical protein